MPDFDPDETGTLLIPVAPVLSRSRRIYVQITSDRATGTYAGLYQSIAYVITTT